MEALEESTNIDFIYKYTENAVNDSEKAIDILIPRLTSVVGFSGILLKFLSDLPESSHLSPIKVLAYISVFIAIASAFIGLVSKSSGNVIKPESLYTEEWYVADDELIKAFVIKQWFKTIAEFDDLKHIKRKCLNLSIGFLVIGLLLFSVLGIVTSINP
jgi:hypothetical protein